MADHLKYPGRLIAVDGTRGRDLAAAAEAVQTSLKRRHGIDGVISRVDASGLFGELSGGGANVSARSLTLVYAADLAFRLRWEIRPILEGGGVVIASAYIDTAVAIGAAYGLDQDWIRELLRFAPAADFRARAEENKLDKGWKAHRNHGYGEYCAAMLKSAASKASSKRTRRGAVALLDRQRGRKVYRTALNAAELAKRVKSSLRVARK
jgi:hypothetical protein